MNKIVVFPLEKRFKKFEKPVFLFMMELLEIIGKNNIYLEIYLAGDETMKFLNKKFRNKNKAADVLSFNEPNKFPHPELVGRGATKKIKPIGEIYLNLINDLQLTTNNSCWLSVISYQLLVHGLLHLLGYNHKEKSDRIKMEKIERLLIGKLKINNSILKSAI